MCGKKHKRRPAAALKATVIEFKQNSKKKKAHQHKNASFISVSLSTWEMSIKFCLEAPAGLVAVGLSKSRNRSAERKVHHGNRLPSSSRSVLHADTAQNKKERRCRVGGEVCETAERLSCASCSAFPFVWGINSWRCCKIGTLRPTNGARGSRNLGHLWEKSNGSGIRSNAGSESCSIGPALPGASLYFLVSNNSCLLHICHGEKLLLMSRQ